MMRSIFAFALIGLSIPLPGTLLYFAAKLRSKNQNTGTHAQHSQ